MRITPKERELERRIQILERRLAGQTQRRVAHSGRPAWLLPAITFDDASYPTSGDELPIVFRDLGLSGTAADWTDRASTTQCDAISPFGWLPPNLPIWVTPGRNNRWQICEAPTQLHGVAPLTIAAATWSGCSSITLGSGTVQVWRKSGSAYVPQTYDGGSAVNMTVKNASPEDAIAADTFLKFARNADNDWIVDFEPCDGACDAGT